MSRVWVLLLFHFGQLTPRDASCACMPHSLVYLILLLSAFPHSVFLFHCVPHSLSLPLSSCLSFILLLIGLPFFRGLLTRCFSCPTRIRWLSFCRFLCFRFCLCFSFLCIYFHYFVCLLCPFLATMSFAGYFPVCILLSAFPAFLLQTCQTVFWLDEEKIIVY